MCRWFLPLLLVWPLGLTAQTPVLPAGGVGSAGSYGVNRTLVAANGPGFSQAVRLQTVSRPEFAWNAGLTVATTAAVEKDDVLAGELWIRRLAPATGDVYATFNFERAGPDYDKSHTITLACGSTNWTRFRLAFRSVDSYAAGRAQVAIHLGFPPQTIELGGLRLTNWARSQPLAAFPNDLTYPGREAEAPWRAAAQARIDRLRRADLVVEVRDAAGRPIPGAAVAAVMRRHAFGFGSAVDGARLLGRVGNATDRDRYRGIVTNWFNKVVLENDLKWPVWERVTALPGQPYGPNTATNALRWLVERGIGVRGHNLIWPGPAPTSFLPPDVPGLFGSPELLRQRINAHFTNILTATRGWCAEWDVINEPYANHAVMDVLGAAEKIAWFRLARALDPEAVLYLNEYGNLELAGLDAAQTADFHDQIRYLQEGGAPIGGIGMQGHFGAFLPAPDRLLELLDRFSVFGLPIQATEFDVNAKDEALQADYVRDFLITLFSHPSVNGILMWGFWEGQHWLPDAALIRRDWTLKPAGQAWTNLVLDSWWTRTNQVTDAFGRLALRGFKGDYDLTVTTPNATRHESLTLTNDLRLVLELPGGAPALRAAVNGGFLDLTWPVPFDGFRLEHNHAASGPAWATVSEAPARDAEAWRVRVPLPGVGTRFYRLAR